MASTIAGERYSQTLGLVLATPARRMPLFLGRALPVIANGWGVAMFGVVVGSLLLDADIPAECVAADRAGGRGRLALLAPAWAW